jgi:F-type H+-transporting ATPase subunit delta
MNTKGARANQYAQAIMQAMVERWQHALASVSAALQQNPQLANTLSDTMNSVDDRVAALVSILPADMPAELSNTLKLMVQEGSLDLLNEVGNALAQVNSDTSGPIKAEVTSAIELSADEQERLRSSLKARHGDNLVFAFHVNPSLMGGLRVRVGDRLIDTSVASRLQTMRESLAAVVR